MTAAAGRAPSARERIVTTASDLFYAHGITRVGVDRVIDDAGVAKATLYQHFRSKDDLVAACLRLRSEQWRQSVAAAALATPGSAARRIEAVFSILGRGFARRGYRGCAFVNAAAEYPGRRGPVAMAIAAQRAMVHDLFAEIVGSTPAERVRQLVMLYDGALVGAQHGDGAALAKAAGRAARLLVDPRS